MRHRKIIGEVPHILRLLARTEGDVRNCAARFAEEMRVIFEIGAVPCRLPFMRDRLYEAARGECVEAVVDRREGNVPDLGANPGKYLDRGGMIAFAHKNVVNRSPLIGHAQAMAMDRLIRRG